MRHRTAVGFGPAQIASFPTRTRSSARFARLQEVVHVYRLGIRTDGEERPYGVEIHTEHARALGSSPVLSHLLGIRHAKDPDDGPLVRSRGQHGPLRIDGHGGDGRLVRLDHVDRGEGDRVKDHDRADRRGLRGPWRLVREG